MKSRLHVGCARSFIRLLTLVAGLFGASLLGGAVAPASAAIPCGIGTYSSTGMEPCQPAPLGYFVPVTGATSPFAAPVGTYVDTVGSPAALLAPPGYYAPTTASILPGSAPAGTFASVTGTDAPNACAPGTASRGGAAVCLAVPSGVPAAVGPDYQSTLATGGMTYFGRLPRNEATTLTSLVSFDFTVTNDATDYGLSGDALSSDLTLVRAAFYGADANRFSLDGFTPGMVLAPGESATFTVNIDPFYANSYNILEQDAIQATLSILTDQGNQLGYDPYTSGLFSTEGLDAVYAASRAAGDPALLGGQVPAPSRQFSYVFRASIPEPAPIGMLAFSVLGLAGVRRRRA